MIDASTTARAKEIVDAGLTYGERRALLRKVWILRGRSGGEILLAERMLEAGLFEGELYDKEIYRTPLADAVLRELEGEP